MIEIKCVDRFVAAHTAQMVTYLRFLNLPHGLLINFKAALLKQGLRRAYALGFALSTPSCSSMLVKS